MAQQKEALHFKRIFINGAFYLILFLIAKDVAFSVSQVTMTSLASTGYWEHFLNKVDFSRFLHIIYIVTLLIAVWNVLLYQNSYIRLSTPSIFRLRFNIQWLSSPTCTSILYFLVFSVGIYFSVISSAINNWIASDILMSQGEGYIFSIVLAILMLSIVVFMLNQIAIGKKKQGEDSANQESYQNKIKQLEDIIRFAPPNGFAKILSDYVDVADDFVQVITKHGNSVRQATLFTKNVLNIDEESAYKGISYIEGQLDLEKVEAHNEEIIKRINELKKAQEFNAEYIRAILIAYARLAALFDDVTPSKKDKDIYRANLMLKYNITDKSLGEEDIFRYVPSVLKDQLGPNIKHYLTLHCEHSVEVNTEKTGITKQNENGEFVPLPFKQDPDITTFSIPFFLGKEKKNYNCFGAPRAVANVETQVINDTQVAIDEWRKQQTSPVEIIDEAQVHFNKRDIAKSIISLPLMHSRYDVVHKSSKHVMGVVNIYRDKTNMMMGNSKKQEQFEHITTPLNFALSKIVAHDMLHRFHANLLLDIQTFARMGAKDVKSAEADSQIGAKNG